LATTVTLDRIMPAAAATGCSRPAAASAMPAVFDDASMP